MNKIKVGVVGYGTIGKRVADAVLLQPDMELLGVTGRTYSFRMELAKRKKIKIYLTEDGEADKFVENGIQPAGNIHDLLTKADLIVDCTPKKIGAYNKERYYKPYNVKAIFQGGEKHAVGEASFNAFSNYDESIGKKYVRVVSCNTTGMARIIHTINKKWPIKRVIATFIRRAADPGDVKKGPVNAIVPVLDIPSHHGPDVNTVLPGIEIMTMAVAVPTTLMHVHTLAIELKDDTPQKKEIAHLLDKTSRIFLVRQATGVESTAHIMELVRDLYHQRGDVVDNCIWENGMGVVGKHIFLMQAIHQESDVIPENIDCIRAMMNTMSKEESIALTNSTLGIK